MVRFPSPEDHGEGVIVEVLGPRGEPGVDTLSVIRPYNLPDEFPRTPRTKPVRRPPPSAKTISTAARISPAIWW